MSRKKSKKKSRRCLLRTKQECAVLIVCAILCAKILKKGKLYAILSRQADLGTPPVHVDMHLAGETWTVHGTVFVVHFTHMQ